MIRKAFLGIVAPACLLAFGVALQAEHNIEQASLLLQRVEVNALDARDHAARLKSYMRFPTLYSWQTHVFELGRVRDATNDIAEAMGEYKDLKPYATPRQNKAFNYAVLEAEKLSDVVSKAIRIANEDKTKLEVAHPEYEKAIAEIYDRADRVAAAIGFAESWEEVQEARKEFSGS